MSIVIVVSTNDMGRPPASPCLAVRQAGSVSDKTTTRRRGTALECAILNAAWDVLADNGWSGFTMDRVAAASSTGKAAVYRRWPNRVDLAVDLLRRVAPERTSRVPPQADLRSDMLAYLQTGARFLEGPFGEAVRGVLTDPEVRRRTGRVSSLLAPPVPDVAALVSRALDRRELLSQPTEPAQNLGQILLTQEYLFCGTVSSAAIEAIVAAWLPALQACDD
jgi:AcrR family transcriptional regulator